MLIIPLVSSFFCVLAVASTLFVSYTYVNIAEHHVTDGWGVEQSCRDDSGEPTPLTPYHLRLRSGAKGGNFDAGSPEGSGTLVPYNASQRRGEPGSMIPGKLTS